MRKEKLKKVGLCFVTGYFMLSPFESYSFFSISQAHFAVQFPLFAIRMTQKISKGEAGHGK